MPVSMGALMYSRGSVMWPVRAEAATVRGLARKTLLLIEPMRPGKLRLVVLMQISDLFRRPKVSGGPPRQAEHPLAPMLQPASRRMSSIDFSFGPFGHAAEVQLFHVGMDFGGAGHDEGGDFDGITFKDVGGEDHVGDFSAGAGADVGLVELRRRGSCGRCLCCRG